MIKQFTTISKEDSCSKIEFLLDYLTSNHGVIGVPTDTVYGLCCLSTDSLALSKLYNIKGRDNNKPLAITLSDIGQVFKWSKPTLTKAELELFLPGACTLIFERSDNLPKHLNSNVKNIGIRIPDNEFIRKLAKRADGPLALTSANISGNQAYVKVDDFKNLESSLEFVVDGGHLSNQTVGSTVIDFSRLGTFYIVRKGQDYEKYIQIIQSLTNKLEQISNLSFLKIFFKEK